MKKKMSGSAMSTPPNPPLHSLTPESSLLSSSHCVLTSSIFVSASCLCAFFVHIHTHIYMTISLSLCFPVHFPSKKTQPKSLQLPEHPIVSLHRSHSLHHSVHYLLHLVFCLSISLFALSFPSLPPSLPPLPPFLFPFLPQSRSLHLPPSLAPLCLPVLASARLL